MLCVEVRPWERLCLATNCCGAGGSALEPPGLGCCDGAGVAPHGLCSPGSPKSTSWGQFPECAETLSAGNCPPAPSQSPAQGVVGAMPGGAGCLRAACPLHRIPRWQENWQTFLETFFKAAPKMLGSGWKTAAAADPCAPCPRLVPRGVWGLKPCGCVTADRALGTARGHVLVSRAAFIAQTPAQSSQLLELTGNVALNPPGGKNHPWVELKLLKSQTSNPSGPAVLLRHWDMRWYRDTRRHHKRWQDQDTR